MMLKNSIDGVQKLTDSINNDEFTFAFETVDKKVYRFINILN